MGGKLKISHLVGKLVAIRSEDQLNPPDVMLGGVGVGNLLRQADILGRRPSVAYLLASPIGWDREKSARHFGLRCEKKINRPRNRDHSGDRLLWRWIG